MSLPFDHGINFSLSRLRDGIADVRMIHDLVRIESSGGGLDDDVCFHRFRWTESDRSLCRSPDIRVPDDQFVRPGRHVADHEPALLVCLGKVWIADGYTPAFHVCVEAALHDKDPPAFAEIDQLLHRRAGHVLVVEGSIAGAP